MVGDGLPEIPRIPPPLPSIANESLSLFLRPARFDFTARYGMSCLEYARATTNLAPRIRESTRIRLCRESNLFHLFVVETFHPIFWINFFFVLLSQFLTGFFPGNWREDIITIFLIFDLILTKQIWLFIYEGMTRNNTGNTRSRCREEYQILHRTIELFPCTLHGVPEETNP